MSNISPNEHDSQAFRISSSEVVFVIPTRLDSKVGQRIILWEDVLQVFRHAKTVLHGNNAVLFMTDDEFNYLTPLRIPHFPGVVLDVVASNMEKGASNSQEKSSQSLTFVVDSVAKAKQDAEQSPNQPAQQCVEREEKIVIHPYTEQSTKENAKITLWNPANFDNHDTALTNRKSFSPNQETVLAPSLLQEYHQLYTSYFQDLIVGQANQASSIKDAMNKHFDDLQVEMYKNAELQVRVLQMQQRMEEKQQEMLLMQKQALNHLAVINNHIQVVLTQSYELHECPIPRLFIVLPRSKWQRNSMGKPSSNQFRLYFLCECGEHTMNGSQSTHEIHLAKHEGYDLNRPKEFFEKYGVYVLTMMQMFKYGVATGGLIVPPLEESKAPEGTVIGQGSLVQTTGSVGAIVDEMISFLEEHCRDTAVGAGGTVQGNQVILDSIDLRQLESYLNMEGGGNALGNLYRIVTAEGYVKWVCIDHYRGVYRGSAMDQLRVIVESYDGSVAEEEGRIKIEITSNTLAKRFYEALIKARGVQELEILLKWDVTMDDLKRLTGAVTKAGIAHLSIDGSYFKGPARDFVNRGRRYDPIMQLMSNGKIQSLRFRNFHAFFNRISGSAITKAPHQRVLWFDFNTDASEKSCKSNLARILENCPSLTELSLKTLQPIQLIELMLGEFVRSLKFEYMSLKSVEGEPELSLEFSRLIVRSSTAPSISGGKDADSKANRNQQSCSSSLTVRICTESWWKDSNLLSLLGRYGWSMRTLQIEGIFNDSLITDLSKSTAEEGSRLTSLLMNTESLSHSGLDCALQLINRSDTLERLDLVFSLLEDDTRLQKLTALLKSHRKKLHTLTISGISAGRWIPELAHSFPSLQWFPKLEHFHVVCKDGVLLSKTCVEWIAAMVSGSSLGPPPPGSPRQAKRPLPSRSSSMSLVSPGSSQQSSLVASFETFRLKSFLLEGAQLQMDDWIVLIKALKFTTLEQLGFSGTNFSHEQFKTLITCIPQDVSDTLTTLKSLDLRHTKLVDDNNGTTRKAMLEKFGKLAISINM